MNTTQTEHNTAELKDRIVAILTESTGVNMLDSGGENGRGWQQNRLIKDWDAIPPSSIQVWDDEVIVQYSAYHYLMNFLDITDESERLNRVLIEIMDESDESYMSDVEEFLSIEDIETDGYACHNIINTYNYENIIDSVLQYAVFEVEDETYIILQVHLGADVRGGYTVPQIFALDAPDYFNMAQNDIGARCECSDWWSDDGGQNWYLDGSCPSPDTDWKYDEDANTVTCNKCRKPVEFHVMESY